MRTSGAEHRGTYRELGCIGRNILLGTGDAKVSVYHVLHVGGRVLTCGMYVSCEPSAYHGGEVMLPAQVGELPLYHGVQLLYAHDLVHRRQELYCPVLGEGEGRCHLEQRRGVLHAVCYLTDICSGYAV